jgi:hypothetical protein
MELHRFLTESRKSHRVWNYIDFLRNQENPIEYGIT